jgi:hypothetical protein
MNRVKTELELVLAELMPLMEENSETTEVSLLPKEEVIILFDKLEPMLKNRETECMDYINEVRRIPGAEELALHIEKCKFKNNSGILGATCFFFLERGLIL